MTTNATQCGPQGLDPDDPAVIAAIDLVRWELSLVVELQGAIEGRGVVN
jgi:hypothetical protein